MKTARFALGLALALGAAPLHAVTFFTDDFNGPSFNAALLDIDSRYAFSGGLARNTGPRSYVRTVDGDFASSDFQADLVYTIGGSGGDPGVFFGIGPGTKDAGFFNEPEAALYLLDHTVSYPSSRLVVRANRPGSGMITDLMSASFPDGTAYLRITKIGDAITFAFDHGYNGVAFVPDGSFTASLSAAAPFVAGGPSYLFFGTANSVTRFDWISVAAAIPEPEAYALLLAGLMLIGVRARMGRGT